MQDFTASVREHVKNTGTKPVQLIQICVDLWRTQEKKNPRPAATETGIKSDKKASSLQGHSISSVGIKAINNQSADPVMGVAT
ncbi:MAG: hypothetical protein ACI92Z_002461 [Paracoccaceae bacterium]|jgi:hypothetical protein